MPTKKPRYFDHLRAFLDAEGRDESLDQGTPRLLAELVDLRARVLLLEGDVEAAADRGQVLVAEAERERNAAVEEANILRSERDQARVQRDGATEAVHVVTKELSATADLLAEQVKLTEEATAARKALAEEADARLAALSRQVDDAASYGRMVGGLVGLVVGVVVTGLLAAAL